MPPLQDITNGQVPAYKRTFLKERTIRDRPGPNPKALLDGPLKYRGPIKWPNRSYSYTRKIEVLLFCQYHRVQYIDIDTGLSYYRPPTQQEASLYWKIPQQTISNWIKRSDQIVSERTTSRTTQTVWTCQWPEMEKLLFEEFVLRRTSGTLIRRSWFRRRSRQLFARLHPGVEVIFVFSIGWFQGFCRRWDISLWAVTHQVCTPFFVKNSGNFIAFY